MENLTEKTGKFSYAGYTPSVFAKTNLIHLQAAGEHTLGESQSYVGEIYPTYLFFLVANGSGGMEYDEIRYELSPGVCGFLDCRKPYVYECTGNELEIKFLYFYGPNMTGIYDRYLEEGGIPCFYALDSKPFLQIMKQINRASVRQNCVNEMLIYEKLISLLTLLVKAGEGCRKRISRGSQKQDLQELKEYLDEHYKEKISLDNLSEMFFINKFYLTRLFKEQFGMSVNSYLIQVRISHARQLLRYTDMSIEKIGQSCGINDANYFARLFKKQEGVSPGEYRKQWGSEA